MVSARRNSCFSAQTKSGRNSHALRRTERLISSTIDPRCRCLCTCRLSHEARVHGSTVCTPRTVCPSRSNARIRIREVWPRPIWPRKRIFIMSTFFHPEWLRICTRASAVRTAAWNVVYGRSPKQPRASAGISSYVQASSTWLLQLYWPETDRPKATQCARHPPILGCRTVRRYLPGIKNAPLNDYQRRNIASRRMHYRPDSPEDLLQLLMLVGNLFSQEPRIAYARFYGNVGRQIADDDQASISVTLSHFMKRRQYGSSPLGHEIGRDEGKFLAASVGVSCRHFDLAKDPHRAGATCVQRVMTHRALRRPITCEEHAVRVL